MTPPNADPSEPLSASHPADAAELLRLSYRDAISLFRSLPAPCLEEMDGEFRAELLDQGPAPYLWIGLWFVHMRGLWLGKAFTPTSPTEGRGYNMFVIGDRVVNGTRMGTAIVPSAYDGQPSYRLDYSVYKRGLLGTMRDEVRKVSDALYLGLGAIGYTRWLRRPSPFLLEGPVAPFAD